VWVALPLQTNPNVAIEPPDSGGLPVYAGTSNTVDGLTKTLTIDAPYWRDPGQLSQVQAYASSVLDSVKDASIDGSFAYYGFYAPAMTFGMSINIAGNDGAGAYTTGWESAAIPVIGVDIEWPQGEGMDYRTTAHCSNRKFALSSQVFMHPERDLTGNGGGFGDFFNPFNISQPEMLADSQGNYQAMAEAAKNGQLNQGVKTTAAGDQSGLASDTGGQFAKMANSGDQAGFLAKSGQHLGTPGSGFGVGDILAAGADTGGGIRDNATNPNRDRAGSGGADEPVSPSEVQGAHKSESEQREDQANREQQARRDREAMDQRNMERNLGRSGRDKSRRGDFADDSGTGGVA
jgi:hypothetical protein